MRAVTAVNLQSVLDLIIARTARATVRELEYIHLVAKAKDDAPSANLILLSIGNLEGRFDMAYSYVSALRQTTLDSEANDTLCKVMLRIMEAKMAISSHLYSTYNWAFHNGK